jgi:hypothetical protein
MSALARSKSLGAPNRTCHPLHERLRCGDANWWRWPLHPRHRHDLDDFYPGAGHLQMRVVFAEYLRGRIMRFGLNNRIASDLIFCV